MISACIHKAMSRLVFHHQVIALASQIVFVVYNLYTTHTEKPCITGALISSHFPGTPGTYLQGVYIGNCGTDWGTVKNPAELLSGSRHSAVDHPDVWIGGNGLPSGND